MASLLHVVFFLFILAAPLSTSAFISDAIVADQVGNGRRLLQLKKPCPVNIENLNYSIITSQCKGPNYPREPCCSSLEELACPIATQLNDLSNNCDDQMFSYIRTVGRYPPGLFSSMCRESQRGLECSPAPPPPPPTPNAAAPAVVRSQILVALLLFSLQFVV